ncbi:hypoxanthine-guanine phosphoribosyltransferase [Spiroplasma sabaudiense Ar-1343]|uniref:Hypoxanthine-guanine phosphoribosyltransferase n=1 Tax=Spiroplasma sabaudiense Ar-1343 TaxID=1276257 RepID=W6AKJ7_9MOLU|nr:phosphoribosyltransferase family protein [Spiroplasma sabaudiense]AHI54234.1 hypoxanthine-guanine phosphoribosyltransferase [Spiroplasma sabaudiense Ar-1343]
MEEVTKLLTVITEEEIKSAIISEARNLSKIYEGQSLVIVAKLSGVFIFVSDLIRQLKVDVGVQFVATQSQEVGNEIKSSAAKFDIGISSSLKGKNVLIVEDILDFGTTLQSLYESIEKEKPKEIRVLTLLDKFRTKRSFKFNYKALFNVESDYFVGYGLAHNDSYRGLRDIYKFTKVNIEE